MPITQNVNGAQGLSGFVSYGTGTFFYPRGSTKIMKAKPLMQPKTINIEISSDLGAHAVTIARVLSNAFSSIGIFANVETKVTDFPALEDSVLKIRDDKYTINIIPVDNSSYDSYRGSGARFTGYDSYIDEAIDATPTPTPTVDSAINTYQSNNDVAAAQLISQINRNIVYSG
jgi:hypothetical protein